MLKYLLTFLAALTALQLQAQVPQYSQYYANALFLSPSFAGADYSTRGIMAARYQWPGLHASYISNTVSVDHYIPEYNSGVGLIINSDIITPANLRTTDVGIAYSYEIGITKNIVFRPGLQMSYVHRRIDFNRLTFGSQYTDNGFIGGSSSEDPNNPAIAYLDFASGGVIMSETFWAGISVHHMNRPNQTFINGESRLPAKFSVFGGYKFMLTPDWKRRYVNPDEEVSISPTFMYKSQGKSDQLDIGVYARYNTFITGLWYRGIPVKVYSPDRTNYEAIVVLVGYIYNNLQVGYSYDFTTSKLSMATWGSHELTLSYRIAKSKKKKQRPIQKRPACPKF
ncbi:type IX secretion system membrane protein PorP/SprF [Cytophagaceae bacterium ABcell3]|nr:type IX secretion system membrane protein PorP/SprF [Cytophagaceae bacterium ABcell3]